MFLNLENKDYKKAAMINDLNETITYGELIDFTAEFRQWINNRCVIFILCENSIGAVSGFISSIENKIVPLMLSHDIDEIQLQGFIRTYEPEYLWVPTRLASKFDYKIVAEKYNYSLLKTEYNEYVMYNKLSMLLATSGSTGSPKLVRHSYENLNAAASNVAESFQLKQDEVAMISLPINFTQGLSTVTSNIYVGGTILLTTSTLVQKEFWKLMKEKKATSFTGVPYSYDILHRLRFTRMNLPELRIINEGGGRLTDNMFNELAEYALNNNKKFIASYGSTETTSRMAYLKPELAIKKCGSIGNAIANGKIKIFDGDTVVKRRNTLGEIVYYGANVTLGYAVCKEDLQKSDERYGIYRTGDIGYFDEDNCIFVVGRQKRFLKVYGYRIGLDETERMLKLEFGSEIACVGTDKKMIIYTTIKNKNDEMISFIEQKTNINRAGFEVRVINEIPKNITGKVQYNLLDNN
ncbi:o-succinylbenzoate--CoA ligase [Clostridium botulinum]|nr:o-succinylbenzoate--CoA ligase [Clostridium botulinum]NFI18612.1 o-succinylbenzoate--CoA ligase [Clostridium botulinum]NFL93228.1 o-succinylbenzoate--CoA ligase [Clostridium botulinum]NFN52790.1 o-succinylbenzoate--CoA ligase [Clostridium botulinum]NFO27757.1 o-succinylbenzoate--CoA ligase [Clostridium botulinum]